MTRSSHEEIISMIADCEERESQLSGREREFIDDIGNQFSRSTLTIGAAAGLTVRQDEWLTAIWERVTA